MARPTKHNVGDINGGLEILSIFPSNSSGKHVNLSCICHYCNNATIINGNHFKKNVSCGCQQRNSLSWKNKGPKTMPWQLPPGESAKRNLIFQYKRSANKRNLDFLLTENEFTKLTEGNCFYCGTIPNQIIKGQGKTSGDFIYNGIDRLDPNLGYVTGNCVPCCWTCNNMKSNLSLNEFYEHIKKILNNGVINGH